MSKQRQVQGKIRLYVYAGLTCPTLSEKNHSHEERDKGYNQVQWNQNRIVLPILPTFKIRSFIASNKFLHKCYNNNNNNNNNNYYYYCYSQKVAHKDSIYNILYI